MGCPFWGRPFPAFPSGGICLLNIMATLLLKLTGPMQSWGVNSKFERSRSTEHYPSKSGIVGLLGACLGMKRDSDFSELRALRFGVRVDHEGVLMKDFQTAEDINKLRYTTYKYYLADAFFVVGLEGDPTILNVIMDSINRPYYPPFLGRKSYPPSESLLIGMRDADLVTALINEPWHAKPWAQKKHPPEVQLLVSIDADDSHPAEYYQRDNPVSYDIRNRQYGPRGVHEFLTPPIKNTKSRAWKFQQEQDLLDL